MHSGDADGCLDFERRRCDVPNRVQEAWPSERNALVKSHLLQRKWGKPQKISTFGSKLPRLAAWVGVGEYIWECTDVHTKPS